MLLSGAGSRLLRVEEEGWLLEPPRSAPGGRSRSSCLPMAMLSGVLSWLLSPLLLGILSSVCGARAVCLMQTAACLMREGSSPGALHPTEDVAQPVSTGYHKPGLED